MAEESSKERLTRVAISIGASVGLLVFVPWNQETFPTAQATTETPVVSSDDRILSHHTEYDFRTEEGIVQVKETISYDHGEQDDGPAQMVLPGYVEHEGTRYELSYSDWMAGNDNTENSGVFTSPMRTLLTLSSGEGPTTGVVEYEISYLMNNSFIQVQEDDIRVQLYPANGWDDLDVERSTVTVSGLPPESNILCEEDCQYDPQEDKVNLTAGDNPMKLTVYFPEGAEIEGNQQELSTLLPEDSTAPGVPTPAHGQESAENSEPEQGIIDKLQTVPKRDLMIVGGILGGGVVLLVISRIFFWRKNKQKEN